MTNPEKLEMVTDGTFFEDMLPMLPGCEDMLPDLDAVKDLKNKGGARC